MKAPAGACCGMLDEDIAKFKRVGNIAGVEVFEAPELPAGTLELWDRGVRMVVVRGLGWQR